LSKKKTKPGRKSPTETTPVQPVQSAPSVPPTATAVPDGPEHGGPQQNGEVFAQWWNVLIGVVFALGTGFLTSAPNLSDAVRSIRGDLQKTAATPGEYCEGRIKLVVGRIDSQRQLFNSVILQHCTGRAAEVRTVADRLARRYDTVEDGLNRRVEQLRQLQEMAEKGGL
jgi:hypothetical protein